MPNRLNHRIADAALRRRLVLIDELRERCATALAGTRPPAAVARAALALVLQWPTDAGLASDREVALLLGQLLPAWAPQLTRDEVREVIAQLEEQTDSTESTDG